LAQDGQDGAGGSGSGTYGPWLYVILYTTSGFYIQNNTIVMDTVNFGKVGIGSTARSSTFDIGLVGGESTTFNLTGSPAIQVSGTDAECFTVTQPSTTSVVTGTYIMDASIAFTPTSAGTKTTTITIPNNSPDKPDFSFTVTGTGSLWPKTYDSGEGDGDDQITCSVMDSQGNVYFIGYGFELVNHHSGNDWWIKKIDSSGNEVVSGWNKKIDFYDNYGYSSDTHDRPTNAVIDSDNNLYVSDGYYTLKFASTGAEDTTNWHKNTGGTLYVDSQNNVYIVTSSKITKYNSSGVQLWTKAYTGKLAFDGSDNVAVYNSDILRFLTSAGAENWEHRIEVGEPYSATGVMEHNVWIDGVRSSTADIYKIYAEHGKTYTVSWNDSYQGDGTKNGDVYVTAYWESDETSIFSRTDSGWNTPKIFVADRTGCVVLKVDGSSQGNTFAIMYQVDLNKFTINSVAFDIMGNIYIAGYGEELLETYSKKDVWIKKYNSSGTEITSGWNKKIDWGHSDDEYATKIIFDGTNIIVAGQGNDLINGASADDGWVKKFNTNGTELSDFIIPETYAVLLKVDGTGNYYFSTYSSYNPRLTKYNSLGIFQFTLDENSPYINYPVFSFDGSNNIYISGYQSNLITPLSEDDWIIKKYNHVGVEQ
jgi:hypothetical protein